MNSKFQVTHFYNNLTDLEAIVALEQKSFVPPWSRESLAAEIDNPLNLTSIINFRSAGETEIIGYSLTRIIYPEAELLRIAISPEMRGQGAATLLLNEVLRKLQTLSVAKTYLEVSEKNHPARALYMKIGFVKINYRPNYYDKDGTGALIMAASLTNT